MTEQERPRTEAGRALWDHLAVAGRPSVERIADFILAIEAEGRQQARLEVRETLRRQGYRHLVALFQVEGRQQAVREIADTLTEHSDHLPITSDGENLRCSPDDAILVAGLNASECGCRHWIRHVVADLWEETPERKVCPECHHDYHPNGPCVAGLNAPATASESWVAEQVGEPTMYEGDASESPPRIVTVIGNGDGTMRVELDDGTERTITEAEYLAWPRGDASESPPLDPGGDDAWWESGDASESGQPTDTTNPASHDD